MPIANCKRCKKVFEKRLSDKCPACIELENENFTRIYRLLQESKSGGGIAIDELAYQVGITVDDVDEMYREGRFGTAGVFLKFQCQACGLLVGSLQRKGRYCVNCSEKLAGQAGVEVKSVQALEKAEAEAKKREEDKALLKKNQPQVEQLNNSRRFGMVRNSR